MAEESQVVSFRLSATQIEVLRGIAEQRRASVGDCAREIVVEGLSGEWYMTQLATQTQILLSVAKQLAEMDSKLESLSNRVEMVEQDTSDTFRHLFEFRGHFKKVAFATLDGLWRTKMSREQVQEWCDKNLKSDLDNLESRP